MFSPDNDFSKLKNIKFCVYSTIISIDIGSYVIVIAYDLKDDIILDVIDDSCSK